MPGFAERLFDRVERLDTRVCLGVDPRPEEHPRTHPAAHEHDPAKVARAVVAYFRELIDAAAEHVACVKLQSAFFERLGVPGLIALAQLVADARERDLPCILDAKRGDVPTTSQAYADAYLAEGVFVADALTVHPYLGMDALEPFFAAAGRYGRAAFVLVRTSNPGAADLQDLTTPVGSVAERLADLLTERARAEPLDARGYGPVAAVVGGTSPDDLVRLRGRLPHSPLLVPGFGAQGADARQVVGAFDADGCGAVIAASRSLTYLDGDDPPREAAEAAAAMKEAVNQALRAPRR